MSENENTSGNGGAGDNFPRQGYLNLDGWSGISSTLVEVVGATPKRLRIRAIEKTRLAGRWRWLEPGETALVPLRAITDAPLKTEADAPEYPEDTPQWLRDLHFMAKADKPIFDGLLANDVWKTSEQDADLRDWLEKGYVELIPGQGFLITEKGKEILRQNKLEF